MSEIKKQGKKALRMNSGGFTLVEVVVTIVILGILLTGGVIGVISWQHNALYNKNNEYAQTIFSAAQSALAHMEAGGNLGDLESYIDNGGENSGTVPDSAFELKNNRSISYLDITMDMSEDKLTESRLYQLLKNYVYDKGIFHAAIHLEFDVSDGTVYSVSYCDKVNTFDYSDKSGSDGQAMGINLQIRKDEGQRRKQLMGYYDTELSQEAPPGVYGKPSIRKVALDNEEALVLRFSLASKNQPFMLDYSYRIELFDDKNSGKKISFIIKGNDLADSDGDTATTHMVKTDIYRYSEEGTAEEPEALPVELTVNEEGEICIILDGVDYEAADIFDKSLLATPFSMNYADYKGTYSFLRFTSQTTKEGDKKSGINIDSPSMFAKVSAFTESYEGKQIISNSENPFMGSRKDTSDKVDFTVNNARHLYNIRYIEKLCETKKINYAQKEDIVWSGEDGIVENRKVFDTKLLTLGVTSAVVEPNGAYAVSPGQKPDEDALRKNIDFAPFPANPYLGKKSVYTASGSLLSTDKKIHRLTLRETKTAQEGDLKAVKQYALGVFRINYGEISRLKITDVRVDGRSYTGTVCGLNQGVLQNISVEESQKDIKEITGRSYVTGVRYVGGIAGSDLLRTDSKEAAEADILPTESYKKLSNAAEISGGYCVGGIMGASGIGSESESGEKASEKPGFVDCSNSGRILAGVQNGASEKAVYKYLGGIVGYKKGGLITGCTSAMGKENIADLENYGLVILYPDGILDDKAFKGDYVGGIAGYCEDECQVLQCETTGGIIRGESFVGGIVGGWTSDGVQTSILDGKGKSSAAVVIGKQYVGGIVGFNAAIDEDGKPTDTVRDNLIIQNWENMGLAYAFSEYAGGIAGYNTGKLINCSSTLEIPSAKWETILTNIKELDAKGGGWGGNYTGGIAGYNNGTISADTLKETSAIVLGRNYTGGLVGYNDIEAKIEPLSNYALEGGLIEGDCFVGGLIGCNASANIYASTQENSEKEVMSASPNRVKGSWFTGGCIGGNLIPAERTVYLQCQVSNQFGQISALDSTGKSGGFAGGFIGYNQLVASKDREKIKEEAQRLCAIIENKSGVENSAGDIYRQLEKGSLISSAGINETAPGMIILDTTNGSYANTFNQGSGKRISSVSEISAGIAAGGIMGGNDSESKLEIQYGTNLSAVRSFDSFQGEEKTSLKKDADGEYKPAIITYSSSDDTYLSTDGETVKYSYTGGIIGRVTPGVTLSYCYNSGRVTAQGGATYSGGLAEISEGTISGSIAQSLGDTNSSYIGGIVGRNEKTGKILNCSIATSALFTGEAAIGGLTAENYGEISTTDSQKKEISGKITLSDICGGGIAGFNAGTIKGFTLVNLTIEGMGGIGTASYIGGITGIDYGPVTDVDMKAGAAVIIKGRSYAGGFLGYMENLRQEILSFGITEGAGTDYLLGTAEVTVTGSEENGDYVGNAGGIIGYTKGYTIISRCRNQGNVDAGRGNAGGITAFNSGMIVNCYTDADVFAGKGICGGIAAVNASGSMISGGGINQKEQPVIITGGTYAGGIAGKNAGSIFYCTVKKTVVNNPSNSTNPAWLGGIAGLNETGGIIGETRNDGQSRYFQAGDNNGAYVEVISASMNCRVGGVAGENQGLIDGVRTDLNLNKAAVYAKVSCIDEARTGWFGGTAGINSGTIRNVKSVALVYGYKGASGGFGGIAGQNENEIISSSFTGTVRATGDANDIVSVGGIAGKNTDGGKIHECKIAVEDVPSWASLKKNYKELEHSGDEKDTVITAWEKGKKTSCGYVGGIAGINEGSIYDINCKNSFNTQIDAVQGNVGGMIGYQGASGEIYECSTGTGWTVKTIAAGRDLAIGGIIGYSLSDKSAYNLYNYAEVIKEGNKGDYDNSAGGIIGRLESSVSSSRKITNCENYGDVSGYARVGGIIGHWKYKGGLLSKCINEGAIKANTYAGGIVGCLYRINADETVEISDCINKGNISAGSSGGILAAAKDSSGKLTVRLTQCVNIGDVIGSRTAGICWKQQFGKYYLLGCRNYGKGRDRASFSGIIKEGNRNEVTMQNCYGVANIAKPVSDLELSQDSVNNFYFQNTSLPEAPIYMEALGSGKYGEDHSPDQTVDLLNESYYSVSLKDNPDDNKLTIRFKQDGQYISVSPEYMLLSWYGSANNTKKRTYKFKISVLKEANGGYEPVKEKGEDKVWEWTVGNELRQRGYDLTDEEASKMAQRIDFDNLGPVYGLRIELDKNSGDGYFALWDVFVDGVTRKRQILGSAEPLYVKANGAGKYKAIRSDGTEYIPLLTENPVNTQLNAQVLYVSIDEQLKEAEYPKKTLANPGNLEFDANNNPYKFSWSKVEYAYQYKVRVNIYDSESGGDPDSVSEITIPSGTNVEIPIDNSWAGKYLSAEVCAISYYGEEYNSAWVPAGRVQVHPALPAPRAYLQHREKSYSLCLENIDEYKDKNGQFYNCSIDISVLGNKNIKISADNFDENGIGIGSTNLFKLDHMKQNILWFQAISDSKEEALLNSEKYAVQTSIFDEAKLEGDLIITPNLRVNDTQMLASGRYEDEFGYKIVYSGGKDKNNKNNNIFNLDYSTYWRSEVMLYDPNLGLDVAAASGVTRVSQIAQVQLNGIAQDLTDYLFHTKFEEKDKAASFSVRSYLWNTQGEAVRYGYTLNQAPLTAQEVKNYAEIYETDGTLKKGYIIERVGGEGDDALYNILYSSILAYDIYKQRNVVSCQLKDDVRQDVPVIKDSYSIKDNQCTFVWDEDTFVSGDSYKYKVALIGRTKDGAEKQIYPVGTNDAFISTNTLAVDMTGWQYNNVELRVTRLGTTKSLAVQGITLNDITDKFCSYSSREFKVALKLPRITRPEVALTGGNQDELEHDISWTAVGDDYKPHLDNYEVHVFIPFADGNMSLEDTIKKLKEIYGDTNVTGEAETGYDILIGTVPGDAEKTVLEKCDLNLLQGLVIEFYVNAIAKESDADYTNSEEGDHYRFIVPERLQIPEDITYSLKYADTDTDVKDTDIMSISEYSEMKLNAVAASSEGVRKGSFKFEAGVYSSNTFSDNGEPEGELLCPAAVYTETPGGNTKETILQLNAQKMNSWQKQQPGDLSGKYLIVRFRITDTSSVSSEWSEYYVNQLPNVRLGTPQWQKVSIAENRGNFVVTHPALKWNASEDNLSLNYKLLLENMLIDNPAALTLQINYLQDKKDFQIKVSNKDGATVEINGEDESGGIKKYDLGTWQGNGFYYEVNRNQTTWKMSPILRIKTEVKEEKSYYTFTLILPDIDEISEERKQYLYTSNVTAANLNLDKESGYADSYFEAWAQIIKDNDEASLTNCILEWDGAGTLEEKIKKDKQGYSLFTCDKVPKLIEKTAKISSKMLSVSGKSISGNSVSGNSVSGNSISGNSSSGSEKEEQSGTEEQKSTEEQQSTEEKQSSEETHSTEVPQSTEGANTPSQEQTEATKPAESSTAQTPETIQQNTEEKAGEPEA